MTFAIIAAVLIVLIILFFVVKFIMKHKPAKKKEDKPAKDKSIKKPKFKIWRKKKKDTENNNAAELKGSYVDVVDKFLFRKELKVLVLVSRVLPKGYVAFPKVGIDTILEPVGRKDLFNKIADKYLDIVVFDEYTMKPKVAIDIFDGSIGDEQLDVNSPDVIKALQIAELPLISIKVKTDYTQDEIKNPIFEALGLTVNNEDEKKNVEDYGEF